MRKYTKLCLATLCFISSVSAFADGYKGEAPPLVPVSIPSFAGGFEFTLGALYMTPDSSNLDYLGSSQPIGGFVNETFNQTDFAVNPNYKWGFLLGVGYVFPNTANDVKLDWMYFHNSFQSSEFLVGNGQSVAFTPGTPFPAVDDPLVLGDDATLSANGSMQYNFDAVDLTFGQYLNFGSRLQTRLFTGLRYARLDNNFSTSYAAIEDRTSFNTGTVTNNFVEGSVNSSFNGLGPMVGIRADYYLGSGLSLTGGIDGALLVGQLSLDATSEAARFTQAGPTAVYELASATSVGWSYDSQQVIAPAFDAKFGLNYRYQFNNGTLVGVELGYQVTKYIDVVEQINGSQIPPVPPIATSMVQPAAGFDRRDPDVTNFRLAGPYLTMNVKI